MNVNGLKLVCPHCSGGTFQRAKILLSTAGMTLLNLDWLNKSADAFICESCRRIEWFVDAGISDEPSSNDRDSEENSVDG